MPQISSAPARRALGLMLALATFLTGVVGLVTAARSQAATAPAATLAPTDDVYTTSAHPQRNYGAAKRLDISRRPAQNAFLRFNLTAPPASGLHATLFVYSLSTSRKGLRLRHASDAGWAEKTLTGRRLPRTGPRAVNSGALRKDRWKAIDVTHLVNSSGLVALALAARGSQPVTLASREDAAHSPRLALRYGAAAASGAVPPITGVHVPAPPAVPAPAPAPSPGGSGSPAPTGSTPTADKPCGVTSATPAWQHVVWIIMENHAYGQSVSSSSAPYTAALAAKCGRATNFYAETHPSLPNYVAMTSGSPQGIADDNPPSSHPLNVPSIFSQLGTNWRALNESMSSNCAQSSSGQYAVKHNPAAYYTNIAAACATQDVALGATPDLSAKFTFITPNLCSDTHDCPVSSGDSWLATWMPKILNSPEYQSGTTAVFLTWDEDDHSANNHVDTVVVSPTTPAGTADNGSYNHYSMLRTTEEMLGLPVTLGGAVGAMSMRPGFHL
jgi:hypothetical protein